MLGSLFALLTTLCTDSILRTVNFKDKLTVSRGTLGVEYRGKSAYQNLTKGDK
jgi:hypothetical protein